MIKQEWKNILKNHWIQIVLVALILIPSIYTVVFLGSMWDPYGNSGDLPVAVVNKDKAVEYNDKKLDVGGQLVDKLKDNDSLDFHFVSAKKANKGLKDGDYYMVITIPSNFSKNATTLLDKNPKKMILNYTTNPGTNYVASKMDDSAIAKIKAEVSSSVTKTYAETIFTSIGTMSDGFAEASDGTQQLSDGMNQLEDGNKTISDNLKVLASSSLTFKDGTNTLTNGLKDYTDGVVTVNDGVYQLKTGMNSLGSATPALANGISQLNSGAQSLNTGINQYTSGVSQALDGANQLVANNDAITAGATALSEGLTSVNSSVSTTLSKGSSDLASGSAQLVTGTSALNKGVQTLAGKISSAATAGQSLINGNKAVNAQLTALMQQSFGTTDFSKLSTAQFQALMQNVDASTLQTLLATYQQLANGGEQLASSLSSTESTQQIQALVSGANQVDQGAQQLNTGVQQLNAGINGVSDANGNVQQAGLKQYVSQLASGAQNLNAGVQSYMGGVTTLQSGLTTITTNNTALTSGASALAQGTSSLNSNVPSLTEGIRALTSGIDRLSAGTSTLVSNNSTLMNGANQLSSGAGQISDGASQLAAGSDTLGDGIKSAADGVTTLNDALKSGAEESKIDSTDKTTDMVATPVETSHKEISKVENNGHAMAPYMMSVGLYVTCLAFALMYPIRHGIKKAENALKYWASKATVMYTVSTLAAIAMVTALRLINGFEPVNLGLTYLLAILVSAAFMSLVMLLSLTTGFIGDFLLLVFMIINLGGSAGTYPLDTGPAIYKAIHKFVPYTYSVDGFRKTISMTAPSLSVEFAVFAGILIVCSILTIVYFKYKNKEDKHVIPQMFEEVNSTKAE